MYNIGVVYFANRPIATNDDIIFKSKKPYNYGKKLNKKRQNDQHIEKGVTDLIKGVNKQVLEITETQNSFFEKAIFFVKPEYMGLSEGKLREHAKNELETTGKPPKRSIKSRPRPTRAAVISAATLAAGIIIGLIIAKL